MARETRQSEKEESSPNVILCSYRALFSCRLMIHWNSSSHTTVAMRSDYTFDNVKQIYREEKGEGTKEDACEINTWDVQYKIPASRRIFATPTYLFLDSISCRTNASVTLNMISFRGNMFACYLRFVTFIECGMLLLC
jgi:hypothetical protein